MGRRLQAGLDIPYVEEVSGDTRAVRSEVAAPRLESASSAAAVTPADSDLSGGVTRALWVGGAGNLSVKFKDDIAAVTITGVPAGTLLPFRVIQVRAATTATSIVALY